MLDVVYLEPTATNPLGRRLSVALNGRLVNVSALARATGLDQSYLSKVLCGKIQPTIRNASRISKQLGMGLEEFIEAIEGRLQTQAS